MRQLTERDYKTMIRAGKILAKRKYYTEDVNTANAIRHIVLLARKYDKP